MKPYYETDAGQIYRGNCLDVLKILPDNSIQGCITSPPYWGLRDYGCDGQLGLEKTPEEYVAKMVEVFREVRRVLKDNGTVWLNLGDSYANTNQGHNSNGFGNLTGSNIKNKANFKPNRKTDIPTGIKPKDLIGIPWRVAFALQADGWWLRQDIIWAKPNPMPESVTDRCTKSHEYIFLMTKSARYFYDAEAIREPIKTTTNGQASVRPSGDTKTRDKDHWGVPHEGRGNVTRVYDEIKGANRRSVWTITTKPFKEAHFATFPPEIPEICIKAGSKTGDMILDPFFGAGTTGVVAYKHNRKFIGIELNQDYVKIAVKRIESERSQLKLF